MDTSRFEQFSSLMTGAAKSIAKLKAAQMEAFSLSGAHTSCLCRLYEAGSLTQGELTRAVQMDRSQVSRVLRDLAQKGYVSADAQAGYKRRYALTPSGRETAARVEAIILDINRFVWIDGMTVCSLTTTCNAKDAEAVVSTFGEQ